MKALAAQASAGAAVLVTTHDPEPWLQVAHQAVILETGAVIWQGSPYELVAQAPLASSAAGEPLSLRLRRQLAAGRESHPAKLQSLSNSPNTGEGTL